MPGSRSSNISLRKVIVKRKLLFARSPPTWISRGPLSSNELRIMGARSGSWHTVRLYDTFQQTLADFAQTCSQPGWLTLLRFTR